MLSVSVISPEAVLFEGTTESIVAPAFDGQVGILTGHAPMLTLLGKGELSTGGPNKDSILSDTLEALFGAVYIAHGLEPARELVMALVGPTLEAAASLGAGLDWKTSLQELSAELGLGAPIYEVEGVGPDHARMFTAHAVIADEVRGSGTGAAKKVAEQHAAAAAYRSLDALSRA